MAMSLGMNRTKKTVESVKSDRVAFLVEWLDPEFFGAYNCSG